MITTETNAINKLPKELGEMKQWICYKTEKIDKELIQIPVDPVTGKELKEVEANDYMDFGTAIDFKENSLAEINVGFRINSADSFVLINMMHAVNEDGEMTQVAKQTLKMIQGFYYGEITSDSTLLLLVKSSIAIDKRFRNIKVSYFTNDYIVPFTGKPFWTPKSTWSSLDEIGKLMQYHYKINCQVDENSEELPQHYIRTQSNQLKLLPNPLATKLLEYNDWIKCNLDSRVLITR